VSKPEHVGLLTYCVESLNLTDQERGLMREILLNLDRISDWGTDNMRRASEVRALFDKCLDQINA
jgi:hypothetical protein